jgi:type I restriction enzyme S subunit
MINLPVLNGWTQATLGDIAEIDRRLIMPQDIQSGTKYVGLEQLDGDGSITSIQVVESGELASSKFLFGPNHILYGKLRPYLRKIVRPDFEGICSTDILPILPKAIDRGYLYHYLRQPRIVQHAIARCVGANLPRISPTELEKLAIHYPSTHNAQQRITGILDKAETVCRKRRAAIHLLNNLLDAVFYAMFGDVAVKRAGYPIQPLRPYLTAANGKSSQAVLTSQPTGIPVYGGNGVNGWARHALYEESVVVVGRVGQQCGITHLTSGPAWVTDNAIAVQVTDRTRVHLEYLEAALRRSTLGHDVRYIDLPYINQSMIMDLPLPLPPLEQQELFVRRKAAILCAWSVQRESLEESKRLFNSLVQRAFRGEL